VRFCETREWQCGSIAVEGNRGSSLSKPSMLVGVFLADRYHLMLFSEAPHILAVGWASRATRSVRWRDAG
jgi:hypothetical protein